MLDLPVRHRVGDAAIVDVPIFRQSQSLELVCDPKALFAAHYAKSVRMSNFILLNSSIGSRREESLFVLCREDCVLADVTEGVVPNASAINGLDRFQNLLGGELPWSWFIALGIRKQVGSLRHAREPVTSHDVCIVQFLTLEIVLDSSHVLMKKALLNTSLDLRND